MQKIIIHTLLLLIFTPHLWAQETPDEPFKGSSDNPIMLGNITVEGDYIPRRRSFTSGDGEIALIGKLNISSYYAYSKKTENQFILKTNLSPFKKIRTEKTQTSSNNESSYYTRLKRHSSLGEQLADNFYIGLSAGHLSKHDEAFVHPALGISHSITLKERHRFQLALKTGYYWIDRRINDIKSNQNNLTLNTFILYRYHVNNNFELQAAPLGYGYNESVRDLKLISENKSNFWTYYGGHYYYQKISIALLTGYLWQKGRIADYNSPFGYGTFSFSPNLRQFSKKCHLSLFASGFCAKGNSYFALGITLSTIQRQLVSSGYWDY